MIDPLIGVGHAGGAALGRKLPKPLSFLVIVVVLSRRQTLTKEKENGKESDWAGLNRMHAGSCKTAEILASGQGATLK